MGAKRSNSEHEPVLVEPVVRYLATNLSGAYLDLTVGPGGHLKALSQALGRDARLYGVDRDATAVKLAEKNLHSTFQSKSITCASYDRVESVVEGFADKRFDGILMDLGISSLQLDDAERGFSFRFDGPLDMRFDAGSGSLTAADLINSLNEKELARILREYGEHKGAGRLARAIVRERQKRMILTTADLRNVVLSIVRTSGPAKVLARVFQAFRIAVNEELDLLSKTLPKTADLLVPGGRLAVISYHSLEDRIVKQFFRRQAKGCVCPEEFEVCVCGIEPSLKILTRRAIVASEKERRRNPRSRSARLRVVEKLV